MHSEIWQMLMCKQRWALNKYIFSENGAGLNQRVGKTHECDSCEAAFKLKSSLNRHRRLRHTNGTSETVKNIFWVNFEIIKNKTIFCRKIKVHVQLTRIRMKKTIDILYLVHFSDTFLIFKLYFVENDKNLIAIARIPLSSVPIFSAETLISDQASAIPFQSYPRTTE